MRGFTLSAWSALEGEQAAARLHRALGRCDTGLDVQRLFGSGDGPLAPLNEVDVDNELAQLKAENLDLIAVGGHDSSDVVIERAKKQFGSAHRYLRVGEPISFALDNQR